MQKKNQTTTENIYLANFVNITFDIAFSVHLVDHPLDKLFV